MGIESRFINNRKAGFLLYGLTILLWILPMMRCGKFYDYTSGQYRETNSINAFNDYAYARELMIMYIVGFSASIYLVWLHGRTKNKRLFVLISVAAAGTATIISLEPEHVIILFTLFPWFLYIAFYLILAAIGTSFALPKWHVRNIETEPN